MELDGIRQKTDCAKEYASCIFAALQSELNPAEHLWDCIRENWFSNKTFKSIDAVEDTLVEGLVALEKDAARIQSLAGFNWIVNDILNAT